MGKIAEAMRAAAELQGDAQIDALLATVQSSKQVEVAAAGTNLQAAVRKLQARNKVLTDALLAQYQIADEDLPNFIDTISAGLASNASVVRAVDTYNEQWFIRLPYSPDGKMKLAQEMVGRAAAFGHRPPVWVRWSRGQGA